METLEERTLLSSGFRAIDGFGNNIANPTGGKRAPTCSGFLPPFPATTSSAALPLSIQFDLGDVRRWSEARALLDQAAQHWRANQHEQALADYSKAIEAKPDWAESWFTRGNYYLSLKEWGKALSDYSKAIELDPENMKSLNNLAWLLATCPDPKVRDTKKSLDFAKKAVALGLMEWTSWNTLGAAHYRAGEWKSAVTALEKSMELRKGGDSFDWFFLAMANWQLGEKDKARQWFDKGVAWMEKNQPQNEELKRFRAEANELLKVEEKKN
jgi:tetratricopeptide (TPR) repeat protein